MEEVDNLYHKTTSEETKQAFTSKKINLNLPEYQNPQKQPLKLKVRRLAPMMSSTPKPVNNARKLVSKTDSELKMPIAKKVEQPIAGHTRIKSQITLNSKQGLGNLKIKLANPEQMHLSERKINSDK